MMMMMMMMMMIIIIIITVKFTCNWNICVDIIQFSIFVLYYVHNEFKIRDTMTLEERQLSIIYISSRQMMPRI